MKPPVFLFFFRRFFRKKFSINFAHLKNFFSHLFLYLKIYLKVERNPVDQFQVMVNVQIILISAFHLTSSSQSQTEIVAICLFVSIQISLSIVSFLFHTSRHSSIISGAVVAQSCQSQSHPATSPSHFITWRHPCHSTLIHSFFLFY